MNDELPDLTTLELVEFRKQAREELRARREAFRQVAGVAAVTGWVMIACTDGAVFVWEGGAGAAGRWREGVPVPGTERAGTWVAEGELVDGLPVEEAVVPPEEAAQP